MALTLNTTLKQIVLTAIQTTFDGGTLTIRTGAPPGAGNTATGTVLATITLPTPSTAAPSGGTMIKAGTWEDASADASGTAAHFRLVATGGSILEGTVTVTGGGGDLTVSNVALVATESFTITSATFTVNA